MKLIIEDTLDTKAAVITKKPLLCFITTVYDTPVVYLEELVSSLLKQLEVGDVHWYILDNGSKNAEVIEYLKGLGYHPAVTLRRVNQNLGIIRGMRYCLLMSHAEYVSPLDSDDVLSSDCVELIKSILARNISTDIMYSDEDKILSGQHIQPYFKPEWDPVLFINSCYIAHLTILRRSRALELGCYSDASAEGCHDWDTFIRFSTAGATPLHIPKLLYSWRIHEQSTAGNIDSKPYVSNSHKATLGRFVSSLKSPEKFQIEKSPFFHNSPDWWIRKKSSKEFSICTILISESSSRNLPILENIQGTINVDSPLIELASMIRTAIETFDYIHILGDVEIQNESWRSEVESLFHMFPGVAMIGGGVFENDTLVDGGCTFGFGRGCDCPDEGRNIHDSGYFAQMRKQHSVDAVPMRNIVVESAFLGEALKSINCNRSATISNLGAWLGAEAARLERRTIFTPFMSVTALKNWKGRISDTERAAFNIANFDLMANGRFYSKSLSLALGQGYISTTTENRIAHLAWLLAWSKSVLLHAAHAAPYASILHNSFSKRSRELDSRTLGKHFSLLTTVYINTKVDFFQDLIATVLNQTVPFSQWVILAHGPVKEELRLCLDGLAENSLIDVHYLPENLGITGGMRWCLERATCEYIIPLDADDLLTLDALSLISDALEETEDAWLVYTDEDFLIDGQPTNPYFRPDWDPVLNLSSSYVWHLCAIRRDVALKSGLYADPKTNLCHDWSTITKIWQGGGRILHIPYVAYHWRQHQSSTSNSGENDNTASVESCRNLLQSIVDTTGRSDLYSIENFPVNRGSTELFVKRLRNDGSKVGLILLGSKLVNSWQQKDFLEKLSGYRFDSVHNVEISNDKIELGSLARIVSENSFDHIVFLSNETTPIGRYWIWDAISYFELVKGVVAVSGRTLTSEGLVLAGGDVIGEDGATHRPFLGLDSHSPGPMALALKPHCINTINFSMCMLAADWLALFFENCNANTLTLAELSLSLTVFAAKHDQKVVFSPLMNVVIEDEQEPTSFVQKSIRRNFIDLSSFRGVWGAAGYSKWENIAAGSAATLGRQTL